MRLSANIAWVLVIVGGIVECFWVSGLKYADSVALYFLTGIGIFISFCCMIIACKKIEVSIAYSVFVGIGTSGVVLSEIVIFGQAFSWLKLGLIFVLLLSVIGLKLANKNDEQSADNALIANISEDLGLDEILESKESK